MKIGDGMEVFDDTFKQLFEMLKIENKKFDFFDIIPPKEVLVSKWVEFILNPKVNGIGNLPVKKLLEMIGENIELDEYAFESIDTEVSTDTLKRIDILIKYEGLWIVIENKIDSYENGNQTNEYYNYIEKIKENNNVIYLYLKPNYNNSIPLNKSFKIITYDSFINKLKDISEIDYIEKDKYKYLKEFIISGGRFMMNEEMEITDSLKFYVDNIDKFEAIEEEYKNKNKKVINMISNAVCDSLNENEVKYQYSKGTNTFIQFYKDNWDNSNHQGVHFEIFFNTSRLVGKKIKAGIVLHIENNIDDNRLLKFRNNNITTKSTSVYARLAYYNDEPIEKTIELDFTSYDKIQESIKLCIDIIKDYRDRYEKIIDDCFDD